MFCFCLAGAFALPVGVAAAQGSPAPPAVERAPRQPVQLSLPLIYRNRVLGEIMVAVDANRPEQAQFDATGLERLLATQLNETGLARLRQAVGSQAQITGDALASVGIELAYDQSRLEVLLTRIEPAIAAISPVGREMGNAEIPVTLQPESTSAYVNILPELRVSEFETFQASTQIFAAARHNNFVVEFDGGYDKGGFGPGFYRRQARVLYDRAARNMRFSAGDLRVENLSALGTAFVAGVAIEKGRRVFNPFLPFQALGPQEFLLDQRSTIEIYSGDALIDTLVLDSGAYNLSEIPARYGLSNARLVLVDQSGTRRPLDYDFFFNPVDLQAGEEEYSATVGLPANNINFTPNYANDPAFSGFYRRGLTNRFILGGGLQASQGFVSASAEVIVTPRVLPGRFTLSGGVSKNGRATGLSGELRYTLLQSGQNGFGDLSVSAAYRSADFSTLSQRLTGGQSRIITANINYARPISRYTSLLAGLSYNSRERLPDFYVGSVEALHRLSDRLFVRGGVEYGTFAGRSPAFGVRMSVTMRFGGQTRGSARANSRQKSYSVGFSRLTQDYVGSYGYDVNINGDVGQTSLDVGGTYIGNRFEARGIAITGGNGLGNLGDTNLARFNLGTSIAFAGGKVAIGRPITDSFVIASAEKELANTSILVGQNIRENQFDAISGALGPALGGKFTSFSKQNFSYDVAGQNQFADIGAGIETIEPPYRSGYLVAIGGGGSISAVGSAILGNDPIALASGTITSPDDSRFEPADFFTNSAGRFAILGLRPGFTYNIRLTDGRRFSFKTLADQTDLVRLGPVTFTAGQSE